MRDFRFWVASVAGIGLFFYYFIPNLIFSDNHIVESGTLSESYVENYKVRRKYGRYVDRQRLVIVTSDRLERKYMLTNKFKKYWSDFQNPSSVGKYLDIRLNSQGSRENPMEIIMDEKTVYGKSAWVKGNWIFIVLFLGVVGIVILKFKK
ncbi:hypothetical protein [Urechidicola croceus]|uniref:DUF3592 domain-containing protein n=1 Tax=Urechidicola croceus TaxID=1850246 RepID=A0A1D8PBK3_9FLAO|nr:hypothetical protein [Urechidicola croceus]AOW21891.1 hypothetical protein LPB138_14885 [Urechidicola croceus]